MYLEELLNIGCDEADVASEVLYPRPIIIEAVTAKILRFDYERAKNDPRPRVVALGRFDHPRTGNKLIAGLNLNYLDDDEIQLLSSHLPQIMKQNSLKVKWWTGFGLMPRLWLKAYRQYDERFVHEVEHAEIEPSPKDYEEPKSPGEPQDAEKIPQPAATAVQKLKKLEAQKKKEPPHEPQKKRGIVRLTKDTIKRLAGIIKNKLTKNRQAKAKEPEPKPEPELDQRANDAVQELERLEKEKPEIEKDYGTKEESINRIDAIIESVVKPRKLTWKSPQNYIYWHAPERFAEYHPRLRGAIVDYAMGSNLICIYNILEDRMVIDLAETPQDVLVETGWSHDETIRFIIDDKLHADHGTPETVMEGIKAHRMWPLIQEISEATFQ